MRVLLTAKVTLPGVIGRTMDEDSLLDPRTFLNTPKPSIILAAATEPFTFEKPSC